MKKTVAKKDNRKTNFNSNNLEIYLKKLNQELLALTQNKANLNVEKSKVYLMLNKKSICELEDFTKRFTNASHFKATKDDLILDLNTIKTRLYQYLKQQDNQNILEFKDIFEKNFLDFLNQKFPFYSRKNLEFNWNNWILDVVIKSSDLDTFTLDTTKIYNQYKLIKSDRVNTKKYLNSCFNTLDLNQFSYLNDSIKLTLPNFDLKYKSYFEQDLNNFSIDCVLFIYNREVAFKTLHFQTIEETLDAERSLELYLKDQYIFFYNLSQIYFEILDIDYLVDSLNLSCSSDDFRLEDKFKFKENGTLESSLNIKFADEYKFTFNGDSSLLN